MKRIKINLNNLDKIKEFIKVVDILNCSLKLISDHYVVNGKSILGILSLDLSKTIEVEIINDRQDTNDCPKELEAFLI